MSVGRLKPVSIDDKNSSSLSIHVKIRRKLVIERSKLITKLKEHLSLYFPVYIDFFNSFSSSVPLNLLKVLNKADDFKKLTLEKYLLTTRDVKYLPKQRSIMFYEYVKENLIIIESGNDDSYSCYTEYLVDSIIFIKENINKTEEKISEIMDKNKFKEIFTSLPGASNVLSAELASQFGENKSKYESSQSVQAYAGTSPVTRQSGSSLNKIKMRMACNKTFRNTLYQFSFCSIRVEKWARDFYDSQRKNGKVHSVAIRSLSNKWAKIIFRMWKDESIYDSKIFVDKRNNYLKKSNQT